MHLLYNFQIIQEDDFNLSYQNRGFQYNDGLFDTLIVQNGKVRFLTDHLDRTRRALQVLGLKAEPQLTDTEQLNQEIIKLIALNELTAETIRVKINIWRKPGGLFTPESDEAETLITVQPQGHIPKIIAKADFCSVITNRFTPYSFFKGPYAVHYVQAGLARKKAGIDEMVLLDDNGNISEALVANIFWIKNNELFTPAITSGCIAGIMRLNILRASQMLQIPVWEGLFPQADLLAADAVFTSNVTGLRPVQTIAPCTFATDHPLISQLENLVLAQAALASF